MINRTIQATNQGAPIKSSAPGIIIKTWVSLVAIQAMTETIGMIPMISDQQRIVIRINISQTPNHDAGQRRNGHRS